MASKELQVLHHISNLQLFQALSDTLLGTSQKKRTKNSGKSLGGVRWNVDNISETQSHVVSVEQKTLVDQSEEGFLLF